jgi:hypothetical protein
MSPISKRGLQTVSTERDDGDNPLKLAEVLVFEGTAIAQDQTSAPCCIAIGRPRRHRRIKPLHSYDEYLSRVWMSVAFYPGMYSQYATGDSPEQCLELTFHLLGGLSEDHVLLDSSGERLVFSGDLPAMLRHFRVLR